MKTYQPKAKEVRRDWHLFDAKDKVLGRLATEIAMKLMGKHKAGYSAHMDMGDNVVVVNAAKVILTGKKISQKVYYRHSGYPGNLKTISVAKLMEERPEDVVRKAVTGMLPDNRLKSKRQTRLKIFRDDNHPYEKLFEKKGK